MRKLYWVIPILLFGFISCDNENESISEIQEIKVQEPDSTAYYDSIYSPYKSSIDSYFNRLNNLNLFNGVILFADQNHVITEKAYGFAHVRPYDSLTVHHTFQLASASKPFTSTAIMQLVEKGKIALNDSVNQYIDSFKYSGITIEMLLTHQSGLSKYTHFCDNPDTIWLNKDSTITNENVVDIMSDINPPLASTPGRKHYYSNTNYILLAQIVENVSGMTFEDYMQENIFTPANMFDTRIYNRTNEDELCTPTKGYTSGLIPEIDIYLNGCVGDKGIYSSARDLYNFHTSLQNEELLSQQLMDSAFAPRVRASHGEQKYGYGWRILEHENNIVFHTGWWKGYRTYFIRIPEKNQVAIVLTNIIKGSFLNIEELAGMLPK